MAVGSEPDAVPGSGHEPGPEIAASARFDSLRRRVISLPALVSFLVAGGFLIFLVTRFDVDLGVTWEQVRGANPWLLAVAFAVHYTTFVFRGARWRLLLAHSASTSGEAEPVPGILFCSRAVLLGWFINSIGWLRLGDAYRAYLYREEHNAAFSGAIGTVLAERVLDVVLVALMLLAAAPFLITHSGGGAAWAWVTLTAVLLVLLLVIVLALLLRLRTLLLRWLPAWLASRYERFLYGATAVRYKLPQTTLLGLLGWAAEMGRMYLRGDGPGIRPQRGDGRLPDPGPTRCSRWFPPPAASARWSRAWPGWPSALPPWARKRPPLWYWWTVSSPTSAS